MIRRELSRAGPAPRLRQRRGGHGGAARAPGRGARRAARPARAPAADGARASARRSSTASPRRCALRERVASSRATVGRRARRARQRLRAEDRARVRGRRISTAFRSPRSTPCALRAGEEDELRAERTRLQHAERILRALEDVLAALHEDDGSAASGLARAREPPARRGASIRMPGRRSRQSRRPGHRRGGRGSAARAPGPRGVRPARLEGSTASRRARASSSGSTARRRRPSRRTGRRSRRRSIAWSAATRSSASRPRRPSSAAAAAAEAPSCRRSGTARPSDSSGSIQKEVRGLGMEHCRVRVALRREPAGASDLGRRRAVAAGPRAAPRAPRCCISANPGEELRPLAKVVSGGELSRTMLAMKTILATVDEMPTLVFDEVDAGIGGRVADMVGQKLAQTAAARQVLCVTHLAPIAAHATHHLVVEKRAARGATRTSMQRRSTRRAASRRSRECWAASASPRPRAGTPASCCGPPRTAQVRSE